VSLVVFDPSLVILVHDSWVNRLVYILRENSNCTEELIRYWVTCGISLFIHILYILRENSNCTEELIRYGVTCGISLFIRIKNIATIDWRAKQQDVVALSSPESELIPACSATQTAVHIRQLLKEIGFEHDEPTMIMEDIQACIGMSNNPILQIRTKHIDVRYHFVREKGESKEVKRVYIPNQHHCTDILTNPYSVFDKRVRDRMMGYNS